MKYSILLPCYNEAHILDITLAGIKKAVGDRKDIEVIVADNTSTDNSVEIVKKYGFTTYIFDRAKKISELRNLAVLQSTGKYLYFLDADVLVPKNIFAALDTFVEEAMFDVLGFVDVAPPNSPWFARSWSLRALARRNRYMPVQWLPGRNIFLPRNYFDLVAGFDETLLTGEDKDFVMRLRAVGAHAVSDPRLTLIHFGFERTFTEWCRKEYWRQHSHLHLLKNQGLKPRLLRFPFLALTHIVLLVCIISFFLGGMRPPPIMMIAWLMPSLGQSLAFGVGRKSAFNFPQLFILYLIRYHIAGLSLAKELYKILSKSME